MPVSLAGPSRSGRPCSTAMNPRAERLTSIRRVLLLLPLLSINGCHSSSTPEPPSLPARPPQQQSASYVPAAPADPWVMETRSWDGSYRGTYLGNGYLGQRMMQSGTGMGSQGPLPAYAAGLYE